MGEANDGLGRMTDDKLANISRAFAMVLITIICLLVFIAKAFGQVADIQPPSGQNSATHDHERNQLARWRLIRIIPAKVTYIEKNEKGTRIEYYASDKNEVENGWFQATKETTGETPKKGEIYWFSYCYGDQHLYGIYALTAEQKKGLK